MEEDLDTPTELTRDDIDKSIEMMMNWNPLRECFHCRKQFIPSYDPHLCDQCFFDQFPKEQVVKFCEKWIEDNL